MKVLVKRQYKDQIWYEVEDYETPSSKEGSDNKRSIVGHPSKTDFPRPRSIAVNG